MKKNILLLSYLLVAGLNSLIAQNDSLPVIPSMRLDGPRVGMTYIAPGEVADDLNKHFGADPYVTQFGWQFETRFFTLPNGTCGLVEFVPLIGGLEQGLFLPNGSMLIGLRNAKGFEFGFGPNVSLAGAAFVLAIGHTFTANYVNFPVNFAVVPSTKGVRFSILFGFNARKK